MKIVSYRGFDFEANGYWCRIPFAEGRGQWAAVPAIAPRHNEAGEMAGVVISERPIPTQIGYDDGLLPMQQAFFELLGHLNPLNTEPGPLVAETNAGEELVCDAIITLPGGQTIDGDVDVIAVTFLTTDPMWRALTETTEGPVSVAKGSYGGFSDVVIDGDAPVHGTVRLTPTAADQQVTVRTFTITNDTDRPWENFPIRVNLGDTEDGAAHPEYYYALIKDGERQRSELIGQYTPTTFLWLVIDYLAAGQSVDYTLLLSDTYLMPGTAFNSYTAPAFDTSWTLQSAITGSTSTVIKFSGVAWETNQWRSGNLHPLSTSDHAIGYPIASNTADTITLSIPLFSTPAIGDEMLIVHSGNGFWNYPVRQTERSGRQRGLWWINQGQKKPGDARFDVPGAWRPWLAYDNDDIKSQKTWTPVANVGGIGSSADYFAILDANRSFPGGSSLKDNGADGVSLSMPFPMTSFRFSYQLKNPKGLATFIVGTRESGGELGFIHEYADGGQFDTLTDRPTQTLTLTDDTIQLYMGMAPTAVGVFSAPGVVQDEIGTHWAGDDGTATSGTSTRLYDGTKEWIPDMWIDATCRIISGTGAGRSAIITDSGADWIDVSLGVTPDTTTRYRITQKRGLVSTVRTNDRCEVTWDTTGLTISEPTEPVDGYILNRTLYLDRDTASSDPPYQQILFDPDDTSRYIVLTSGETFVIDGAEMRAWIEDASGDEVRAVPPRAVIVQDVEADGTTRLAERWLWLTPGEHDLKLSAKTDGNDYDLELSYTAAVFG